MMGKIVTAVFFVILASTFALAEEPGTSASCGRASDGSAKPECGSFVGEHVQ